MAIKKYLSLDGLSEYDALVKEEIANAVNTKANSSHTHTVANVTNLQTTLDSMNGEIDGSIKNLSVSGKTITYTKNDGSTGTITTQDTNTDTKVTNTLATTTKAYVTGTTSATTNTSTQVFDTGVYLDTTAGQLTATTFKGALSGNATSATKATQDGNGKVISSTYETKSDASAKLTEAKTYADSAATKVKNDLLNGAGGAYDTLKELGDLIDVNVDAIDALEAVAANKADKSHTHTIANVTGLQSALDGKAASSHGTHVSYSSTAPVMDGTASVGTASTVARSDHKHPTDTSRASKTEFDTHASDTTKHITSTERTNWNVAKTHADSAHAPSNAEKNQNAFSNIAVNGQTTVVADTATDTLTLVGSNVTITTDATNDKITFSVADGSTGSKGLVQLTNSTSSTSTTTAATPNSVKSAYDLANTAKTAATNAQTAIDELQEELDKKSDYIGSKVASQEDVFYCKICTITIPKSYSDIYVEFDLVGRTSNRFQTVKFTGSKSNSTALASNALRVSGNNGNCYEVKAYQYVSTSGNGDVVELWCKVPSWDMLNVLKKQLAGNGEMQDWIVWNLTKHTALPTTSDTLKLINASNETWSGNASTATTATKLGTSTVGSSSQPIYLNSGTATKVTAVGTAYGGTGATSVSGARTNLDVYSKPEVDTKLEGKAASGHSHSDASTSAAGFMSAAMVTKLNGIATGANKTTVDSSLSTSSTNPVQNKVVATALNTATSAISTNTSSINAHSTAISNLQTAVAEIQDITSAEIQALFA